MREILIVILLGLIAYFWPIMLLFLTELYSDVTGKGVKEKRSDEHPPVPGEPMVPETNVGCTAIADSDLAPSGRIRVNGKRYHAISDLGFIAKGDEISITGIRMHQYVVRMIEKQG